MANVIDLLSSDDEDESPNKAAKTALDSFAPRKDRRSQRHEANGAEVSDDRAAESSEEAARSALDTFAPRKDRECWKKAGREQDPGPGFEGKDTDTSPGQAARSVLIGFLPRKDRQNENAGSSTGHGQQTVSFSAGRRPRRLVKVPPDPQRPHIDRASHMRSLQQQERPRDRWDGAMTGSDRRQHLDDAAKPEQGSLAALLQQAQKPHPSHTREKQSPAIHLTGKARPSKIDRADERTRRAEAYNEEYGNDKAGDRPSPQQRRPFPASGTTGPRDHDKLNTPRFRFPSGWSPAQRQANRRKTPPLEIVDVLKDADNELDDHEPDANTRPLKRPRLSKLGFDVDIPVVKLSKATGNGGITAPIESEDVVPQIKAATGSFKHQYSMPPASPETGKDRSASRTKSNSIDVSPRLGNTTPTKLQQRTSMVIQETVRLPQSAKSSTSSGKKRAKPWHVLHKTYLKPTGSGDASETAHERVIRQSSPSAATSKQHRRPSDDGSAVRRTTEHTAFARGAPGTSEHEPLPPAQASSGTVSNFGNQYTPEEDALLAELKEVRNVRWEDMPQYFKGRTRGSLQVRYSSKVSKRHQQPREKTVVPKPNRSSLVMPEDDRGSDSAAAHAGRRQRKKRNNDASAVSGMISWAEVGRRRNLIDEDGVESRVSSLPRPISKATAQSQHERVHPWSFTRILRQRELGENSSRGGSRAVPDEMKEQVFDDIGPLKYHKGTSGDVTCLAWSGDGTHFAAGSIAISDERSMQYNRPGNLIIGDYAEGLLHELPEHHIPRPAITVEGNVDDLHAMRESQDPRLFMTVATVQFSSDGQTLYSAGTDAKVRAYNVGPQMLCSYEIEHTAPLDLLSVSNANVLATACHQSADRSIGIYRGQEHLLALSPSRLEQQTSRAIYPSALRWGISHHHSSFLLAGFSINSIDEERDIAGEACLWDVAADRRIQLPVTRNVFDVAWNPRPTSTSTVFAVASTPGAQKVSKGTRTVVQCFAPNQGRASRVLEWESPAFDINDIVYCQHDDNMIAAGATDGKVYVWDQRFAGRRPTPLHILQHGDSLNVLEHDRPREFADTGVRFLSWGATSSRLYTGSSDGVVKIWNPYMATENAHIKDAATFGSAVMSGAFSPDYRDLLIGEDQGRINSLSIGHGEKAVRSMRKFDFVSASTPASEPQRDCVNAAHELVRSQQIVLRPMGDLPIRQAVQGPKYSGSRLMPAAEEMQRAQHDYDMALHVQSDARARLSMLGEDDEALQAGREADRRLAQVEETLGKLQSRREDAIKLYPQAFANQYALHKAEKQRLKLESSLSQAVECCKLDCNYLPANVDEDGKVPDSGRSEGRIPGNLRALPREEDTSTLTPDELLEAALTSKCVSCSGPAATAKSGLPVCGLCATTRHGLTAKCTQCAAPVRPQTDPAGSQRCERCSFACFRCGQPAIVATDRRYIRCNACHLTWPAGVLGYELVVPLSTTARSRRRSMSNNARDGLEFGEDEMERLAARWGTTS